MKGTGMESGKLILIVEDDRHLSELTEEYLKKQRFRVLVEENGNRASERIFKTMPDLVILDLMLPGKDGLSICRDVRSTYHGPILMLTAREDIMDEVAGLETGADDYVKKPVEPRVLLARIRALLRRGEPVAAIAAHKDTGDGVTQLKFGKLQISRSSLNVYLSGEMIKLSTTEFDLLWLLAAHSGTILDRETIYTTLKGTKYDGMDRSIDICISRLRKKLMDDPQTPYKIKTVWGSGYLFVPTAWE